VNDCSALNGVMFVKPYGSFNESCNGFSARESTFCGDSFQL